MLSIGKVGSSGGAAKYFASDNYYTDSQGLGPSEWFGEGAKDLGLSNEPGKDDPNALLIAEQQLEQSGDTGKKDANSKERDSKSTTSTAAEKGFSLTERHVDATVFESVLNGNTGTDRVGYMGKDGEWKHMEGRDLVFAPSKSVSIMALVGEDKRIVTAFQDSVKETLGYAERNYASAQVKNRDGSVTSEKTGNIVSALFTHDTSRNQDPLLHVHAVVANMTKTKDGDWKSLWMKPLFENRYKLSEMQDKIFEKKVQNLGYKTSREKGGHFEISEVPQSLKDAMSSRRNEIEAHMKEGADWNDRQRSTYATRAGKVELERSELNAVWKDVAKEHGFDAKAHIPSEQARDQTPERGHNPTKLAVTTGDSIRHLTTNKITLERMELVQDIQKRSTGHVPADKIEQSIQGFIDKGALVEHGISKTGETTYTTTKSISTEKEILSRLNATKDNQPIIRNKARVVKMVDDTTLRPGQRDAAIGMLTEKGRYIAVQGSAGTGKTYSVGEATKILEVVSPKKWGKSIPIHGLAPTKNSAKQLSSDIGKPTITAQRFLAQHTQVANGYAPTAASIKKYKGSIVIMDESSMLSNGMMKDLMTIADALEVKKLYLVGDAKQHEAVKSGPAYRLLQSHGIPVLEVVGNTRQKDSPRLLQASNQAADGNFKDFFKTIDPDIKQDKNYIKNAASEYVTRRASGEKASDVMVLSPDNRTRNAVNAEIRKGLQSEGKISSIEHEHPVLRPTYLTPIQASYTDSYSKGDVLMFSQDLKSQGIKRGDTWKITAVDKDNAKLTISNGKNKKEWVLKRYTVSPPFEHMKEDTIKMSKGEEVRFKNDNAKAKLEREDLGKVTKITDSHITIRHQDGRNLVLPKNENASKILDHAYTSTTYAAQGLTRKSVIMTATSKTKALSKVSMYIGMTRSKFNFSVHTDNKIAMIRQVMSNHGQDVHALDAVGLKMPKDTQVKDRSTEKVLSREKSLDKAMKRASPKLDKTAERQTQREKIPQGIER